MVRGFEQVQGVDYGETFAPVIKYTSIRVLCSEAAAQDLDLDQVDFKTAFLNGDIDEDIYMEVPEGVEITKEYLKELDLDLDKVENVTKLDIICKLEKSMYGTKQAPRSWNKKIDSVLSGELGFVRSEGDPCLYVCTSKTDTIMIGLYVDDMLLASKNRQQIEWLKKQLGERFEMKDLDAAKVCLGLEITRIEKTEHSFLLNSRTWRRSCNDSK